MFAFPHDQNRTMGMTNNALGRAAEQEVFDAGASMGAYRAANTIRVMILLHCC